MALSDVAWKDSGGDCIWLDTATVFWVPPLPDVGAVGNVLYIPVFRRRKR